METLITEKLDENQLKLVEELVDACNKHDKSNISAITDNSEDENSPIVFFLFYSGNTLISFLSLYKCYDNFAEITAFTRPEFRNNHLFSKSLNLAKKFCTKNWKMSPDNMTISTFCDIKNNNSIAVAKACHFKKMHTEYSLIYLRNEHFLDESKPIYTEENIFSSESNDNDFLIKLHSKIFNLPTEASKLYVTSMHEEGLIGYVIYKQKEPIGMYYLLTVAPEENQEDLSYSVYICAFGILPRYQRNHYGTAALKYIIDTCDETVAKIGVQVSDQNRAAFRFYNKFGFKAEQALICFNL